MEELILVAAYCPDIKRQDILRNLIRKLYDGGKDIFLISHSLIPEDIVKQCKFFFYDEENKLLTDSKWKYWVWCQPNDNFKIWSKDVPPFSSTILPCYRNILFGLGLSKLHQYKYVHYVEYDSDISDINFFKINTDILKQGYGNVSYYFGDNQEHIGGYCAYNLDFYSYEELEYNESKILTLYEKYFPVVEVLTKNEFLLPKNPYFKAESELKLDGLIHNLYTPTEAPLTWVTPFVEENNLYIFIWNNKKYNLDVTCITNKNHFNFNSLPNHWLYQKISDWDETESLKIYVNNQLLREYKLDQEINREMLISNNFRES